MSTEQNGKPGPPPTRERLLWTIEDVAFRLNVSISMIKVCNNEGFMPSPLRLRHGGKPLWRAQEIEAWVNCGIPLRDRWTWEPAQLPKYNDLLTLRRAELASVERELAERKQELQRRQ